MITVTAQAAAQIRAAAEQNGCQGLALRIAAKRAADGSIEYGMGFDGEREQDIAFESAGVALLVSELSRELVQGATLDFVELAPGQHHFIFDNPNEASCPPTACGSCGSAGGCGSNR